MSRTSRAVHLLQAAHLHGVLRRLNRWHGALVLAYHRIGDPTGSPLNHRLFSAGAEAFDAQLRLLRREAEVVGPQDVADLRRRRAGRCVLITFDDGYRDAYDAAYPLLRAHGLTGVFFVVSSYIDRPRMAWWDELAWMVATSERDGMRLPHWLPSRVAFDEPGRRAAIDRLVGVYKRLPTAAGEDFLSAVGEELGTGRCPRELAADLWVTWDMVREMRDAGMHVGGHTASHPILSRTTPARQRQEVRACATRLRRELGEEMRWFAYPVGERDCFDAVSRAAVAAAGVELAFSCYGGAASYDRWDPLDVPRFSPPVVPTDTPRLRAAISVPTAFARW